MPCALLDTFMCLSSLEGDILLYILSLRKLRSRDVTWLAWGHITRKKQSQNSDSKLQFLSITPVFCEMCFTANNLHQHLLVCLLNAGCWVPHRIFWAIILVVVPGRPRNLCLNKHPKWVLYILKFEHHRSTLSFLFWGFGVLSCCFSFY